MSFIIKSIIKNYKSIPVNSEMADFLQKNLDLDINIAEIFSKYPVLTQENALDFKNPKLKNMMPDILTMLNMDLAVKILSEAIINKKKIGILGDYDVDGVTSSSMLKLFLNLLNCECELVIPDRFKDGYGPSNGLFDKLSAEKVELVLTLDCGTVAFGPIEYAKSLGIDVIVVDHHISEEKKPEAVAIVNPNQIGDTSNLGYLCAAGVTFLLCCGVYKHLSQTGYDISQVNLINLTPFTAIGSVCDMMKMIGVNRAFYATGISVLNEILQNFHTLKDHEKSIFTGLYSLLEVLNVRKIRSSSDIGFKIGPVLNAAGRLHSAMTAVELLTSNNEGSAMNLAHEMVNINSQRRGIQEEIFNDALEKAKIVSKKNLIFVISEEYNEGVIGIVAARIKDVFNKTVIIGSVRNDGNSVIIKASCRAIDGVDIGSVVLSSLESKLILKGGGHKAAAGFSAKFENFDKLYEFMENYIDDQLKSVEISGENKVHAVLNIWQFEEIYEKLTQFEPFGISFERPSVVISGADVVEFTKMSEKYSKIKLKSRDKIDGQFKYINCVYFGNDISHKDLISSEKLLF